MSVQRFMVKSKIPRRAKGRASLGDPRAVTKRRLTELYVNKGLSQVRIAGIFRLSPGTIFNKLREFEIPTRKSAHVRLDVLEIGESYTVSPENSYDIGNFYHAATTRRIRISLKTLDKNRIKITRVK